MRDYIRRFIIAGIMALCVTLLFLGGKHSQADLSIGELTANWTWPADGLITDTYGTRKGSHKGIDIAAPLGTPIYSVDEGTVTKSYYSDSYGHVVFVRHGNNTETVYAHLQNRLVNEGEVVQANQQIGQMGSTGDSSGVHLHFEVHLNEWTVDKRNAVDPKMALGEISVGEYVAFAPKSNEKALETLAKAKLQENVEELYTNEDPKVLTAEGQEVRTHVVQNGETLWSIATQNAITVEEIMGLNELQTDKIIPSQVLKLE